MKLREKLYEVIKHQPHGTEDVVNVHNIIIPHWFKKSPPKGWKMEKARALYEKKGFVDKPITVREIINKNGFTGNYLLVDEFTRLLVLKENHMCRIPIKIIIT